MATEFLDEEEAADHAHARAGDAAQPLRPRSADGRSRLRRLREDDARRRAGKAPRREGRGRALRLLQPRACATTSAQRERKSGVEFQNFHAPLPAARRAGPGSSSRTTRRARRPPEYLDEELPLALVDAIEELGPQYDALFVDEAQDLENHWLDALMMTLKDPRRGPGLAVHRRQPARLRGASSTSRTSSAPSTSPSTAATPRRSPARSTRSTRARSSPRSSGPRAARSSC